MGLEVSPGSVACLALVGLVVFLVRSGVWGVMTSMAAEYNEAYLDPEDDENADEGAAQSPGAKAKAH
jgi:hypothetical protein